MFGMCTHCIPGEATLWKLLHSLGGFCVAVGICFSLSVNDYITMIIIQLGYPRACALSIRLAFLPLPLVFLPQDLSSFLCLLALTALCLLFLTPSLCQCTPCREGTGWLTKMMYRFGEHHLQILHAHVQVYACLGSVGENHIAGLKIVLLS